MYKDTFVILELVDQAAGFSIASSKALITSREDLYLLDYLLKPDFILKEER
ncbi:hypothetical protein NSS79_04140 [Paenibacillus sp. FSL L8-0436]|uniref:hypothetical protein n=1 Tax=Paenibacillus sp. FSL L8-0436 TaxID=2954686 RepID=UPI0031587373